MATDVAGELLHVVEAASESLRRIDDSQASLRSAPGTWSKKEILGHLLDSEDELRQHVSERLETLPKEVRATEMEGSE